MLAVLYTDGELNLNEIRNECVPGKWVPIFVYRMSPESNPIIPVFRDCEITKKFAKRNLPSNWPCGGIELTDQEVEWMKNKGWSLKEMSYPHRVDNYICGFEILEFSVTPDFRTA